MTATILGAPKEDANEAARRQGAAWAAFGMLGTGVFLVGIVDVALLWWPVRLGDVQWEFGVTSGTFESLPLSTIGLALLGSAFTALSVRNAARVTAGLFAVLALGVLAAFILYGLAAAEVLHAVDAATRPVAIRAVVKTGVFGVTYVALYATLAAYLWKANRPSR